MTVVDRRAMPRPHALQLRLRVEEFLRARAAGDLLRTAAPHRSARIDPNPHQVEAVRFALERLREGGCILADEVGLGKTIEAGLVIAQVLAEGARRVLLITPKSLVGQWRQELAQLFGIEAREGAAKPGAFDGDGVFLVNREAAGSVKGAEVLRESERFDLCVIDEAHEVFAGIYQRFGRDGRYDEASTAAQTAGRVRQVLRAGQTPVLLLTATPIQNNLAELWGLVSFVDPFGTLLGELPTFREVFCGADDRQLARGQEHELRERLRHVLQRTLRRQAQPFLEKPFVGRQARLFDYTMSASERSLYDDVTRYLLEPGILAFQGRHRQLLLLGFHRRMASSTRALATSLERVAGRLRKMSAGLADSAFEEFAGDLEEDVTEEAEVEVPAWATPQAVNAELARVEAFVMRARSLGGEDSKFRALLKAFEYVTARAKAGQGSGKLVIFTESLVTQEQLRTELIASGAVQEDDVTLFRGTNDSPRAKAALQRWLTEVGITDVSPDIAVRLALVHEFKTRSKVFISTEAGAKGLNLQFCDTLVNYDLPWNPQRIEQRIGRCHRYGQKHDVTVINFLARDNEAQALTFDILSRKLELFGTVLDASDQVLHRADGEGQGLLVSALGAEFEGELRRIWERARTVDEVTAELRALRDKVAAERQRFEETHARTASVIEQTLDDSLQRLFRSHREQLPVALSTFDLELRTLLDGWATLTGAKVDVNEALHLRHPLVQEAFAAVRALKLPKAVVLRGAERGQGRLQLVRVCVDGFEREERVLVVAVLDDGRAVSLRDAVLGEVRDGAPHGRVSDLVMTDAREEALFELLGDIDQREHARAEDARRLSERVVEDRLLVLRRHREVLTARLDAAAQRLESSTGSEQRTSAERSVSDTQSALDELDERLARLARRDDDTFRQHQTHIYRRRYTPPQVEVLADVEFTLE